MANEREIVIRLKADGTAEVVDALKQTEDGVKKTGAEAEDSGKKTEKAGLAGRTAFWGLGQAAEELGQKVGITGQANRRLGNTVEDLASRMPQLAMGFGLVTLATGVAVTAYNYFINAQKEKRAALAASVDALRGEVSELYRNTEASKETEKASYNLLVAKKALLEIDLAKDIREQRKELGELEKAMKTQVNTAKISKKELGDYDIEVGFSTEQLKKMSSAIRAQNADQYQTIEILNKKIAADEKYLKTLDSTPTFENWRKSFSLMGQGMIDALKDKQSYVTELARMDMVQADNDRRAVDLIKAKGADQEAIWQAEILAYDSMGAAKISAAKNNIEATKAWDDYEMGRQILILNHTRDFEKQRLEITKEAAKARLDYSMASGSGDTGMAEKDLYDIETAELLNAASLRGASLETINMMYKTRELQYDKRIMDMRLHVIQSAAGQFATAFQMMYQMGGAHARKWFQLWKTAAIAESIVSTYKGASAALSIPPPPLGMALAAAITAAGMANVARISATDFGSSTTGGASGTYGVSSSSGTPNYAYFDYESSRYGSGWRPGESETRAEGGQQVMHVTIQAIDSKNFEKYVRDNPQAIQKVLKDIEGGYV